MNSISIGPHRFAEAIAWHGIATATHSASKQRSCLASRKRSRWPVGNQVSGKGKCVIREINTFILAQKINFVKEIDTWKKN